MKKVLQKLQTPMTACPLPEASIKNAIDLLNNRVLTRYGETSSNIGYAPELEKRFAKFNNTKYSIAVNSGAGALFLALRAAGVKQNDSVM